MPLKSGDVIHVRPRIAVQPVLTPAEWRAQSRRLQEVAEEESTDEIKHRLRDHALNLAFLAEKIERNQALRD